MDKSIAWLTTPDNVHNTFGIEILSKNIVQLLEFRQTLENLCGRFSCHYFIQGWKVNHNGVSWLYFEFFGEGNQEKILSVIEGFSSYWHDEIYNNEVLFFEPDRSLLESLKLF